MLHVKLQIYLGLGQAVSLRSRRVYLGALSDDLDKLNITADRTCHASRSSKSCCAHDDVCAKSAVLAKLVAATLLRRLGHFHIDAWTGELVVA